MHPLPERLLTHVRRHDLLTAGERVGVAVSGGIDSIALLRLMLELRGDLGIVLSVVHFNHKLRGAESEADEQFVASLAREHNLELHADSDDVARQAEQEGVSLETAARELRYGFFRSLLERDPSTLQAETPNGDAYRSPAPPKINKICTGHTLDDQAETVLMRVIRGSGLRGIGGIYPRLAVEHDDGEFCGEIVRPLLAMRRRELQSYLQDVGQCWREDATNEDAKFTRNRVRKLLLPMLENEFNPAVAENLAELAEIARGEEDYWENEVAGWMGTGVHWAEPAWARAAPDGGLVQIGGPGDTPASSRDRSPADLQSKIENAPWLVMNASLDRLWFVGEPLAVQRRIIKAIGEHAGIPLEFKHVEEILRFGTQDRPSGKELSLPLGWKFVLEADELKFLPPDLSEPEPPHDYEYDLPVPGQVTVFEIGSRIEATCVSAGGEAYNPENLLSADSLHGPLKVRNWRAGDRFWPAHTKSPKKIKELLQERHVAQPDRKLWPVVASGEEIVWVRGFELPAKLQAKPDREAILISEITVAEASDAG